jgi:threonine dehydratase
MTATPWHLQPPDYTEIEAAAARLQSVCKVTALLESAELNRRLNARLLVKAENLQHHGSFKIRGAYNCIVQLTAAERARGVVAYSSGNHAQGVAAAARMLGVPATIVMPADAPQTKLESTRNLGADLVLYDRYHEDREAICLQLVRERGLTLVPPYEDRRIIAGAGTLGRELILQARELGVALDLLLVNCSGGGLTAGCGLALATLSPATRIIAVEPAGFDDTGRSLRSGARERNDTAARSICDSLLVSTPGALTFSINQSLLSDAVAVSDEEVIAAMRVARDEFGLTVEPGGVVSLAAVLSGRAEVSSKNVAVIFTGGNVDPDRYTQWLG